jgi:hypothetical protein
MITRNARTNTKPKENAVKRIEKRVPWRRYFPIVFESVFAFDQSVLEPGSFPERS